MSRKPTFPRAETPASAATQIDPGDDAAALAFLGLEADASPEEIAAAHEDLVAYLAGAPRSLWGWARAQASVADEALVTLTDPTARRSSGALSGSIARSAELPGGPATPPARRALPQGSAADDDDEEDTADFEAMLAEVTPSLHRESLPTGKAAAKAPRPAPAPAPRAKRTAPLIEEAAPRGIPKAAILGAVAVLAIGVVAVVWKLGSVDPGPVAQQSAQPSGGLDEAAVAALMEKIQANPKDTASLLALGNAFYKAQDYSTAITWFEKLLAIDPKNTSALLAVGAANFNLGQTATAKAKWEAVLAIDEKNVEAHYDLGFLYFNSEPQDVEGVKREWGRVIELAPGEDIAKIVQAHLDALEPAASGSPAASGAAPSAAPSPAPSVAPSPEASK